MPNAAESLLFVIKEAEDIARATQARPHSGHVLLAFFTSRNQADVFLRDRGIDEDRLLDLVDSKMSEPRTAVREIFERAAQVAAGCGTMEVDCLHALVAMTRVRDSLAYSLLNATGEKLSRLRTRALNILTGAVPRWLDSRSHFRDGPQVGVHASRRPSRIRSELMGESRLPGKAGRGAAMTWNPPLIMSDDKPRASRHSSLRVERRDRTSAYVPSASPAQLFETPLPSPVPSPQKDTPAPAPSQDDPAAQWLLSPDHYPWLSSLGRNMSADAARGELDRLIGRKKEVETLIDVLGKRRTNNPCLIGEPGVGKTAVVEGLAHGMVNAPEGSPLRERIIVALDVGALLVGTHLRGSFSEKLQGIKEEVRQSQGRVVIFFDELHTLVGAGSTGDGPQDAANELKGALARGDFPCIGATTCDEYVKHIEPDAALRRRLVPVFINEPARDEAIAMLDEIAPAYAEHHRVEYDAEAIAASVDLSTRYIPDRHLPDKAIALLDLAGSRASRGGKTRVDRDAVATLVADRAQIPVERVLGSDRDRLLNLEGLLQREVIGHAEQLTRIAEIVRHSAAGFGSHRPQGVFLFVGPTGVGKTQTAKALANILHGSEGALLRFDLSEFSEAHAVARLVGAPPGYVGYEAGGQLTEAVRKRPGCILLLDEVEKAHRDVLQLLLQVFDEGRLTDGHGRTVSFSESIIIMTSNLGSDVASGKKTIGFGDTSTADVSSAILDRAKSQLAPELWGRIQEHLVFSPLTRSEVRQIAQLLCVDSSQRLTRERGITYELDEGAIEFLLDQGGFDLSLGARPMRNILARIVEGPIAARILEGRLRADEHVLVSTRQNGGLAFLVGEDRLSLSQRPPI